MVSTSTTASRLCGVVIARHDLFDVVWAKLFPRHRGVGDRVEFEGSGRKPCHLSVSDGTEHDPRRSRTPDEVRSVHWTAVREGSVGDLGGVTERVQNWSRRKQRMFAM